MTRLLFHQYSSSTCYQIADVPVHIYAYIYIYDTIKAFENSQQRLIKLHGRVPRSQNKRGIKCENKKEILRESTIRTVRRRCRKAPSYIYQSSRNPEMFSIREARYLTNFEAIQLCQRPLHSLLPQSQQWDKKSCHF